MGLPSRFIYFASGIMLIITGALGPAMAAEGGYHLLTKYPFGAAEGSTREYFDYITVDSSARRVYLSHGTEIKVINADTGKLIGNITGLKQDHGVAIAPRVRPGIHHRRRAGKGDHL